MTRLHWRITTLLGVLGALMVIVTAAPAARASSPSRSAVRAGPAFAVWLPLVAHAADDALPPPFDQVPPGDWLGYVNAYRAAAELPPVSNEPAWWPTRATW